MKNKKGSLLAIMLTIGFIMTTISVAAWLIAEKKQLVSSPQQQQQTSASQQNIQSQQQTDLPIINLNKFKEEGDETITHVTVEYRKDIHDNKEIIHDFTYKNNPETDFTYKISYLTSSYLVVQRCGGPAPCSDYLFDLKNLRLVEFKFPTILGNVSFFENEKYVTVSGPGRIEQPGIAIEILDGRKVYCLISSEEVSDVSIDNETMSFMEHAFVKNENGIVENVATKREINIVEFCKNK